MDKVGAAANAGFDRVEAAEPAKNPEDLYSIMPETRDKPYDVMEIIERLVDNSEFEEYKATYGKTILCGLARIDGWAVGIVANQRKIVKNKKG